ARCPPGAGDVAPSAGAALVPSAGDVEAGERVPGEGRGGAVVQRGTGPRRREDLWVSTVVERILDGYRPWSDQNARAGQSASSCTCIPGFPGAQAPFDLPGCC